MNTFEGLFDAQSRFASVAALMDADEVDPLDLNDFDNELWLLLCRRVRKPGDLESLPEPVSHYYASRYMHWEVLNGGFAQAAYNIPDLFERAEKGYRALGRVDSAGLIHRARQWLPRERAETETRGLFAKTIGEVFAFFDQSRLTLLDSKLSQDDWNCDEVRIAYVRQHRAVFRTVTA